MKLPITQIVLGTLIVIAACYITGWMIYDAPEEFTAYKSEIDELNKLEGLRVTPTVSNTQFDIARISSYILPILGLLLVSIGSVQLFAQQLRKPILALSDMITGGLVAGITFVTTWWGQPLIIINATPTLTPETLELLHNGYDYATPIVSRAAGITLMLAMAVVVIGVIQLILSRKKVRI